VELHQDKLRSASEIIEHTALFFRDTVVDEEEAKAVLSEETVPAVLSAFLAQLQTAGADFTVDGIKSMIKSVQKETGCKGKALFMPIRAAITGQTHGPDLNQSLVLLGQEKVIAQLQHRLGVK